MPTVIVEAIAPMASWRAPEAQTYHRTLPLPPFATQVGLLGAALGLDLPEAWRFVERHDVRLGAGGWANGKARDLWKFQKLELVERKQAQDRDIVLREHWIDVRLAIVLESPDEAAVEQIALAFRLPAFPLTAGPSDALMRVVAVSVGEDEKTETWTPHHAMIYGEIDPDYGLYEELRNIPLTRSVQAPTVERLPTGFQFDDAGNRSLAGRALITFIADPVTLKGEPVRGFCVAPKSRFLKQRPSYVKNLSWVIPVHRYT